MQGVNAAFNQIDRFRVGIYGTRNVAQHVIDSGLAVYAFVSDMSTGYSGNLGYPMAKLLGGHINNVIDFELGKEYLIGANQFMRVTFEGEMGAGDGPVKIKNGVIEEVELAKQLEKQFGSYNETELTALFNKTGITSLGAKISNGGVKISAEMTTGGLLITMEESIKGMMHQDNLPLDCKVIYKVLIYNGYFSGNDVLKVLETDAEKIRAGVLIGLDWLTNQIKPIWVEIGAFLAILAALLPYVAAAALA
ncbi:hypothetical protein FC90_GL000342 [Latilactobacillus graminis DSM 20719]|uniref:Uncharacterized protein n=2 Tax=Latilactobacillus graminis TaxID=60519 RepID=A0AA89I2S3_9LACO|nr:hypothetical protein FC90_GL000342 [Latilactobacillus graminis DSM 20719]